jgi:hypothetical protein
MLQVETEVEMRRGLGVATAGLFLAMLAGCRQRKPAEPDVLNVEAKMPSGLPAAALDWRMITSGVDRDRQTMTMLTGNDPAVKYAGTGMYPEGSELALVTWLERDDPHWFGARIPGTFVSLETVEVKQGADGKPMAEYHRYEGNPAHEVLAADAESRKIHMLGMTASEMP